MSILGKVLAVLNILGVAALAVLGLMDYGKRQTWAHSNLFARLAVDGLPMDEQEVDNTNRPRVNALVRDVNDPGDSATLTELFPSNPVATQKAELVRVKKVLDDKVGAAPDDAGRIHTLSRFLLPLQPNFTERDRQLVLMSQTGPATVNERLRRQLGDGLRNALVARKKPENANRPFRDVFLDEVQRIQPGTSKRDLAAAFLDALPAGKADEAVRAAEAVAPEQMVETFLQTARGDASLDAAYVAAARRLMQVRLTRAFRPALAALVDVTKKDQFDPAKSFLAAYLQVVKDQPGEPLLPFAEALLEALPLSAVEKALKAVEAEKPDWGTEAELDKAKREAAKYDKAPEVIFLRAVAGDKGKDHFDVVGEALDRALTKLAEEQKTRFDNAFKEPIEGVQRSGGKMTLEGRKEAAARLLLALADEVNPATTTEGGGDSVAVQRVLNVVGLSAAASEARRQAAEMEYILIDMAAEVARERLAFAAANLKVIDEALDRADYAKAHRDNVAILGAQVKEKDRVVKARIVDIEAPRDPADPSKPPGYKVELAEARAVTAQGLAELRKMSDALYDIRVKVRDATRLNQDYEVLLRYLEDQARQRRPGAGE
jgi:hypothetical protein